MLNFTLPSVHPRKIQAIYIFAKFYHAYGSLNFFLTQDHIVPESPPRVFIQSQPNLIRTLVTMGEYKLLLFMGIGKFKNFLAFGILTWGSMRKS